MHRPVYNLSNERFRRIVREMIVHLACYYQCPAMCASCRTFFCHLFRGRCIFSIRLYPASLFSSDDLRRKGFAPLHPAVASICPNRVPYKALSPYPCNAADGLPAATALSAVTNSFRLACHSISVRLSLAFIKRIFRIFQNKLQLRAPEDRHQMIAKRDRRHNHFRVGCAPRHQLFMDIQRRICQMINHRHLVITDFKQMQSGFAYAASCGRIPAESFRNRSGTDR